MPETRNEILIKKVFESDFSWDDLEEYFNLSRAFLFSQLSSSLHSKEKLNCVANRILANNRSKSATCYLER